MRGSVALFSGAHSASARESGSTDDWGTPQRFYDILNQEFSFTLDPCANAGNAKAAYFSIEEGVDGLAQDWGDNVCFVNFPYSQAKAWAKKCVDASQRGATVVVLCAARTDTGWWQELAIVADEIRFIRGRLSFVGPNGQGQGATFPSSVIVLRPRLDKIAESEDTRLTLWEVPAEVRRG